jgi:hypothetical protein
MSKLVHVIAVVIGYVLWRVTGNIIIAAVVAVIIEGIILAILVSVAKHKNAVAAAIPDGRTLQKKLWWRIMLLVVCSVALIQRFIHMILDDPYPAPEIELPSGNNGGLGVVIFFLVLLVFSIVSLVKAIQHNKRLTAESGTAEN